MCTYGILWPALVILELGSNHIYILYYLKFKKIKKVRKKIDGIGSPSIEYLKPLIFGTNKKMNVDTLD